VVPYVGALCPYGAGSTGAGGTLADGLDDALYRPYDAASKSGPGAVGGLSPELGGGVAVMVSLLWWSGSR